MEVESSLSTDATEYVSCNGSKRRKLDDNQAAAKPSCVLHIRGLPNDVTESEVAALGQPFGSVTNVILTRNKNQSLLELADLSSAQMMVEYYSKQPVFVRSSAVFVQYSNHSQLKLEADGQSMSSDSSRCILHVIVDNMVYPITVDMLNQIFSAYGTVLRIVTFNKNNSFQALIQYSDATGAHKGKLSLNGHNIFNGCCKLHIEYSKLKNLAVKYNNDKSRDYTNPNLPWDSSPVPASQDKPVSGCDGLVSPVLAGRIFTPRDSLLPLTAGCLPGQGISPFPSASFNSSNMQPLGVGSVLLVSNLNESKVTPDALFTLFGVYGDVVRVKVLFNKKDKALVQFREAAQAQLALTHLDYVKLWGKQLELSFSKFKTVQMPKEGTPDAYLTQDYTTSPWHRFRNSSSNSGRARAHVVSPSDVLHLSNIPPSVTEDYLKDLFGQCGTVVDFKFFDRMAAAEKRMALIQMTSVEEAVVGLVMLHNTDFGNCCRLCVSFTKSTISHSASGPS